MAHNPPRFEWHAPRPQDQDDQWLMVNRRMTGRVVRYTAGVDFYAGFLLGERVPGDHASMVEAQRAVEEAYRDRRWS